MTKNQLDNIIRESVKHVKKWEPVMKAAGVNNSTFIELLSCYAEYFQAIENQANAVATISSSSYGTPYNASPSYNNYGGKPSELGTNLMNIIEKTKKLSSLRVKVENTPFYYNTLCNKLEYKLENGEYITSSEVIGGSYTGTLARVDIISAFPDDFVKLLDMSEFREMRLNSLIA